MVTCQKRGWRLTRAHPVLCRLWPIVDVLMPISFLQPVLTFALVWSNGWEKWNAAYWDSLVVSAPLLIFSRAAVRHLVNPSAKPFSSFAAHGCACCGRSADALQGERST